MVRRGTSKQRQRLAFVQEALSATLAVGEGEMLVDSQRVIDGGGQIFGVNGPIGGVGGDPVGRAIMLPANAAAGQERCLAMNPVVPSRRSLSARARITHLRRAAHFRRHQHHRLLQEAASFQIFEEGREAGVKGRQQHILELPEDIATGVLFLASPAACYITGQVLTIDGGMTG